MTWLDAQIAMFDQATNLAQFAVNWLLQSTLLIAAGLLVSRLLRDRGSAAQSIVYRTTLVAVLACPLATLAMSLAGIPGWSVKLPAGWSYQEVAIVVQPEVKQTPPVVQPELVQVEPVLEAEQTGKRVSTDDTLVVGPPIAKERFESSLSSDVATIQPVDTLPPVVPDSTAEMATPEPNPSLGTRRVISFHVAGIVAAAALSVWVIVAVALVARLGSSWWHLSKLRSSATPADRKSIRTCEELSTLLRVRPPTLLRSPFLPSPCLAGITRPAVLLPEEEGELSLRDILLHELAHLSRLDCHWNLLRRVGTALFFFQPLLWVLSRRMEVAAEEVCDDFVVHYGGDRQQYAHRLVDIAELSTSPLAKAGVGIVSLRSMLARRVSRIMDTSRTLSTRVSNLLLVFVIVSGVVGVTAAGLVGLSPNATEARDTSADMADDPNSDEAPSDHSETTVFGGVVLDQQGHPVENARVCAIRVERLAIGDTSFQEVADSFVTDISGKFEFTLPKLNRKLTTAQLASQHYQFYAAAPGFAPAFEHQASVKPGDPIELQLATTGPAIEGQIVSLEGQPIEGVTVLVRSIQLSRNPEDFHAWLDEAQDNPQYVAENSFTNMDSSERDRIAQFPSGPRLRLGGLSVVPNVSTNAEGKFRLPSLGPNRLVTLEIQGKGIATDRLHVVTHEMESVPVPQNDPRFSTSSYYGAKFHHPVATSQTIRGILRDADTRQPLAGQTITVKQFGNSLLDTAGFVVTTTDEQGRYQLEGLPAPDRDSRPITLYVVPNSENPYFRTEVEVPKAEPGEGAVCDIELKRASWVVGRLVDATTGEPLEGLVSYFPFLDNQAAGEYANFRPGVHSMGYDDRYATDSNGNFRVPAIPGRGILAAIALRSQEYAIGHGADKIADLRSDDRMMVYHLYGPELSNTVQEVNVPIDQVETRVEVAVEPLDLTQLDLVDAQNRPISGAIVGGAYPLSALNPSSHLSNVDPSDSSSVEVWGLKHDGQRMIVFLHKEKKMGLAKVLDSTPEPKVRLEPCARIIGQLVEMGEPVRDIAARSFVSAYIPKSEVPEPESGGGWRTNRIWVQSDEVDSDGRFELDRIVPGARYELHAFGKTFEIDTVSSDETIDLGTIDITSDERPEPVRTKPGGSNTDTDAVDNSPKVSEFAGAVVEPSGDAASGARLYMVFHVPQATGLLEPTWKPVAVCDEKGAFRFTIGADEFGPLSRPNEFQTASLVAVKEGYGFGWSIAGFHSTDDVWIDRFRDLIEKAPADRQAQLRKRLKRVGEPIKLVEDSQPIRGRVMNINGQPVEGVRFTLKEVWACEQDDLSAWRVAAAEPKADYYTARMQTPRAINGPQVRSLVTPAVTDANGRFELTGIGPGRITELLMEGPGIESAKLFARTELGESIELPRERRSPDLGTYTYYPAEFTVVAGPSTPITGVVRDSQTGETIGGVTVKSQKRNGEMISGWGQDFVRAVTDEQGRYRLEGMPIGSDNRIAAIAPEGDVPYFSQSKQSETTADEESVEIDFDLVRGVWLAGQITDRQSGEGVSGRLSYYVAEHNPAYDTARNLGVDERDRLQADAEGRFKIAVLPGPGFLAFQAHNHQDYPRSKAIIKPDGTNEPLGKDMVKTRPSYLMPQNYHLVAQIDPVAAEAAPQLQFELGDDDQLVGRVVDPDGKAVTNYDFSGRNAAFSSWESPDSGKFTLLGYSPDKPRHLYVANLDHSLAAYVLLEGEQPDELVVQLQAAGHVRGRLVDEDGAPLANCRLIPWSPPMRNISEMMNRPHTPPLPRNLPSWGSGQYETDEEGNFEFRGLVPGVEYRVQARKGATITSPPTISGPLEVVIQVEPGESKDLGNVRLIDEQELVNQLKEEQKEAEAQSDADSPQRIINGTVTLPDGKPAAGVHIAMIARSKSVSPGGTHDGPEAEVVESITNEKGEYHLEFSGVSSDTHYTAYLVARKDGYGIAWEQLNPDEPQNEVTLTLAAEQPIRGQLLDLEGQPLADVVLRVQSVVETTDSRYGENRVGFGATNTPRAWLPELESDADGRFVVRGVPVGYGVYLETEGDKRIAPQGIALNTGQPEQRGPRDGTYRSLTRNGKVGEELTLPLAPAQLFEGQITYADTGEPAPHARVTIWASQQELGSMITVAGEADDKGRYSISPNPGIRFGISAYPPPGVPYLVRKTPFEDAIHWRDGDTKRQVDLSLTRGVLVRGSVTNSETGEPIEGASIQYMPESNNNPHTADDILTGWQNIQLTDEAGLFEIVVLPGPGRLVVHAATQRYIVESISSRKMSAGKEGGNQIRAHGFYELNPVVGSDPLNVSMELTPSSVITVNLADENEQPVDDVVVINPLRVHPYSLNWRGDRKPVLGGKADLSGLVGDEQMQVSFLQPKLKLGATVTLDASDVNPTVILKPCGVATARFVDPEGKPLEGVRPILRIVASPGKQTYDYEAARMGEVLADSDFVANIDRVNYSNSAKADKDGILSYPALIPGATYRLIAEKKLIVGGARLSKYTDFEVKPGETLDLGEFVLESQD
ncbi:M56 family metallopeptidase [Aeoliella sp.]|uniref:M56 family metallopeptidase n=1 Tax=Aeoliella sp. TaxID=2795800 RepID=UPI003CCBCCE3